MPSAIEGSLNKFHADFVASYGSLPSWLAALLAELAKALPGILGSCGVPATAQGVQAGMADNELGTSLHLRMACREAGVPLRDRSQAVASIKAAAKGTSEPDMANILTFAQAA